MISRTTLEKHERGMIVNEERGMEKTQQIVKKLKEFSDLKIDTTNLDLESIEVLFGYVDSLVYELSGSEIREAINIYKALLN